MPILRSTNLPSIVSPTRTLTISPLPLNVAIGLLAGPKVPMYFIVNCGGTGAGGGGGWRFMSSIHAASQASPMPLLLLSFWSGLYVVGQLSRKSGTPSLSLSGGLNGGGGCGGGGGGGGSTYAKRFRALL